MEGVLRLPWLIVVGVLALTAACGGGGGSPGQFTVPAPQEEPVILRDSTGLLVLTLPAGTVSTETSFILRDVTAREINTPGPEGRDLLVAWEFSQEVEEPGEEEPPAQEQQASSLRQSSQDESPTGLAQAAELTVNASYSLPAGHSLSVYRKSPVTSAFEDTGETATVAEDAPEITLNLTKFGVYGLFSALPEELPPPAPAGLVLAHNSPSVRVLEWSAVSGAAGYSVYRSTDAASGFSKINAEVLAATAYTDFVTDSATHYYYVTSESAEGLESGQSNVVTAPALQLDVVAQYLSPGSAPGQVSSPQDILWLDTRQQFILADTGNRRVQLLDRNFNHLRSSHAFGQIALEEPVAVAANAQENLVYIVDRSLSRVIITNADFAYLGFFGLPGSTGGRFRQPEGVAVAPDGRVVVADTGNDRLQVFTPQGVYLRQFGASGDGDTEFNSPTRLAFTAAAELLVADAGNARIMQYSVDFDSASPVLIETEGVPELVLPSAFSLDHFGNIFAADPGLSRVVKFDPGGGYLLQFGSTGTRSNQFGENAPTGLAINAALGKLFVCDPANNRILEYRI